MLKTATREQILEIMRRRSQQGATPKQIILPSAMQDRLIFIRQVCGVCAHHDCCYKNDTASAGALATDVLQCPHGRIKFDTLKAAQKIKVPPEARAICNDCLDARCPNKCKSCGGKIVINFAVECPKGLWKALTS